MNISEKHIDIIEAYLQNTLSEKEVLEFDARLVYDSEFAKSFSDYQQVEKGINQHFRNKLKQNFQKIDEELDCKPLLSKVKPVRKKNKLVIMFSIAAAAVLILFVLNLSSSNPYEELVAQNWPQEEGLPVKMSNKGKYDDAMNAYKLKEWDKAEKLLIEFDSDTANYYLGVVNYHQQELENAVDYFEKVAEISVFIEESEYRMALILLIEESEKGKKKLLEISKSNSIFSEQAKMILKKL